MLSNGNTEDAEKLLTTAKLSHIDMMQAKMCGDDETYRHFEQIHYDSMMALQQHMKPDEWWKLEDLFDALELNMDKVKGEYQR